EPRAGAREKCASRGNGPARGTDGRSARGGGTDARRAARGRPARRSPARAPADRACERGRSRRADPGGRGAERKTHTERIGLTRDDFVDEIVEDQRRTPRRRVERRRYALRGEPPRDLAAPCALEVAVMRAEPLRRGVLEVLEPGSPRLLRQQGRGR